jgi:hypothetical protein
MSDWIEITPEESKLQWWNRELLKTSAEPQQYPYWNERFRAAVCRPRYIYYPDEGFACALDVGFPGLRVALIQFGPVSLSGSPLSHGVLESLVRWARRTGFAFLRVVHYERQCLEGVSALPRSESRRNWFPFNAPPKEDLMVHQRPDESEMLGGFQKIARQEIKAAREYGYEIQDTHDSRLLRDIWHIFREQGSRKGIPYGPVDSYALLMDEAKPQGLAHLYMARLAGKVVYASLICRGAHSSYHLIGALDRDAMRDAPTPSSLLHWTAMRDLYQHGVTEYNLGTRSGPVYAFKRKFRPEERTVPPPVSVICSPLKFHVWTALLNTHTGLQKLRGFKKADRILRRLLMRRRKKSSRGKMKASGNSENPANMSDLPRRT